MPGHLQLVVFTHTQPAALGPILQAVLQPLEATGLLIEQPVFHQPVLPAGLHDIADAQVEQVARGQGRGLGPLEPAPMAAQQQHRQGCEQHQQQDDDGSDHLFLATRIMHFQRKGSRPTPENFTTSKPF